MKNVKFRLWGNKIIFLDYNSFQSMYLMYNYIYDWEEFNLISHFVKPGDVVGDVGSNMGVYTIWMSKFITAEGSLHCFEPDTMNFDKLKQNIRASGIEQMTRVNKLGLSNNDGEINFTYGLDGENHIAVKDEKNILNIEVKRLDTYADENKISFFSYLKVDVEGFEFSVLEGSKKLLLEKRIKIIQLELNNTVRNSGINIESVLQFLKQSDYALCRYDVSLNKLQPTEFISSRENYFAVSNIEEANRRLDGHA